MILQAPLDVPLPQELLRDLLSIKLELWNADHVLVRNLVTRYELLQAETEYENLNRLLNVLKAADDNILFGALTPDTLIVKLSNKEFITHDEEGLLIRVVPRQLLNERWSELLQNKDQEHQVKIAEFLVSNEIKPPGVLQIFVDALKTPANSSSDAVEGLSRAGNMGIAILARMISGDGFDLLVTRKALERVARNWIDERAREALTDSVLSATNTLSKKRSRRFFRSTRY
jgi:hypothetical protein